MALINGCSHSGSLLSVSVLTAFRTRQLRQFVTPEQVAEVKDRRFVADGVATELNTSECMRRPENVERCLGTQV